MDVEQGAKIQTKGTDNLFNTIIAENFPNLTLLAKEQDIKLTYRNQ
jgi:hypothetical protein